MRRGGASAKGSAFERRICKDLSLWVSEGKREDLFWRTAMSGGRATVMRRKGIDIRQSGDICSVAPEGHDFTDRFYVECKHYKKLDIESFLIKNKGTLAGFWAKAVAEAAVHSRIPLLIVRQNMLPVLVITFVRHGLLSIIEAPGVPGSPRIALYDQMLEDPFRLSLGFGLGRRVAARKPAKKANRVPASCTKH